MTVTIVGGGLAGLIASAEVAERGASAILHERSAELGGRARTSAPPYRTNFGPHAVYRDGPLWKWLQARDLLPATRASNPLTVRFVWRSRLRRTLPRPARHAMWLTVRRAPSDRSYREWVAPLMRAEDVDACCRVACFYSFAADPGELAADFVNERNARLVRPPSPARFVADGGWQAIVAAVAEHARRLGVDLRTGSRIESLPAPPVIVALEPQAAAALLGTSFEVATADAVLLDLALDRRGREPSAVIDLDGGAFIERYTAFDTALAPEGQELLQCHAGIAADGDEGAALARIEAALDVAFDDWRPRERWRAVRRSRGRSGAVELPGAPWSSRPPIDRGGGVYVAGDWVASPGLLSEVAVRSAITAATAACG